MKLIKIFALICLLVFSYSCNYKKKNNKDLVHSKVESKTTEKYIIKEEKENEKEILQLIELMLTTSPRYIELTKGLKKKVVKNGGLDFGVFLERSPQDEMRKKGRYSKTYDFTIYEMYEDRRLNTSRFSFNPEDKQLFEYSIANDSLVPIELDETLLLKYDSLIKKE